MIQKDINFPAVFLPLFEHYYKIVVLRGGRNSTKTWTAAIFCLMKVMTNKANVVVTREVHCNIEETIYKTMQVIIDMFGLVGFEPPKKNYFVYNGIDKEGNKFTRQIYFKGIKGGSKEQEKTRFKGLEDYQIMLIEEAENLSEKFFDAAIGTMRRRKNYQIVLTMNPFSRYDFVTNKIIHSDVYKKSLLDLFVNYNHPDVKPFLEDEFLEEMLELSKTDPEKHRFLYLGEPIEDIENCIITTEQMDEACKRSLEPDYSDERLGVDIAREGKDLCVFSHGWGPVQDILEGYPKTDFNFIVGKIKELCKHKHACINIDATGDAGSFVVDYLRKDGYINANLVRFGSNANEQDLYGDMATEMYFTLRKNIQYVSLKNNERMKQEFVNRGYTYDNKDRYKLVTKAIYKKLYGHSCDFSDAVALQYKDFSGHNNKEEISALIRATTVTY